MNINNMTRAVVLLLLALGPLACEKRFTPPTYPMGPVATPTPTLTSLPTSTTTFSPTPMATHLPTSTSTFTSTPTATFSPTSTATMTFTPTATANSTCQPVPTTIVPVGLLGVEMAGTATLYNSLTQWQAAGLPSPPVDFSTQMVILIMGSTCSNPVSGISVISICEDSNQITISAVKAPYCGSICNYYMPGEKALAMGIVFPQSSLPVVWNITNLACNQLTPIVVFHPITATPTPTP